MVVSAMTANKAWEPLMARILFVAVLIVCDAICCHGAERYVAMFADGSRAFDAEIRDWNEPDSPSKIGDRLLFDPRHPVRWIIDRDQPATVNPTAFVQFVGGDRVAGEVIAYSPGADFSYEARPPHLVLKPVTDVLPPDVQGPAELHLSLNWVQRVVWQHVGSDELRPGTLWLRSGASMSYRSIRWAPTGVTVLTNEGIKPFPMADLGEIHLPKIDPWSAYYEQLAALSFTCQSRIVQISSRDGSRWTTSTERFQSRSGGDRNRPDQWLQLIQPAWCLEPIWLRYRTIRNWRFHSPHEVPLSNFTPIKASHEFVFGEGLDWQTDQNVQHGRLQSADQEFGWGFGVHGTSELVFEFPQLVRSIRTKYGMDRLAGGGGCVNVEVTTGNGQSLLKQSNVLGDHRVGEMDWRETLVDGGHRHQIHLRTEMAHQGRPDVADPFDVRDLFNWYEPEVRLDQAMLVAEVASRAVPQLHGLMGWSLSPEDSRSMVVTNAADASDPRDPSFRLITRTHDRFYLLSRKVKLGPQDRWFAIAASRFAEHSTSTIQIRIDGRVRGSFEIPVRQSMTDPQPIIVPIEQAQGRTVLVELIVYPADENSWIDWRGCSSTIDRPGLLTIFEDDMSFAAQLKSGSGQIELDSDAPFSGERSLKVTPGAGENARLPSLEALICEHPSLGQYRYLCFAWKKSTGTRIQLRLANAGRLGDVMNGPDFGATIAAGLRRTQTADDRGRRFSYCYEEGVATTKPPIPLWMHGDLPREWQLIQRDVFNDFGQFIVTGLAFNCVDGETAWFDHVYLARTKQDLEYAAVRLVNPHLETGRPDANGELRVAKPEDYSMELARIAPLFSPIGRDVPLGRIVEFNGEQNVLKTEVKPEGNRLTWRAGLTLPSDPPKKLELQVSHPPDDEWLLIARVNGHQVYSQKMNKSLTESQQGWAMINVDLKKYAGQKIDLEVSSESIEGRSATTYWKKIAVN